jgi:hypothetical protein
MRASSPTVVRVLTWHPVPRQILHSSAHTRFSRRTYLVPVLALASKSPSCTFERCSSQVNRASYRSAPTAT